MNKLLITFTIILSLIISFIFNFNSSSIKDLLIGTSIVSILIFIVLYIFISSFENFRSKNFSKGNKLLVLGIFISLILLILYFLFFVFVGCSDRASPAHFRTNIITNECSFGGYSPNTCVRDPWYYQSGCSIPNEEKIDIHKNTKWFDYTIRSCKHFCEQNSKEQYCSSEGFLVSGSNLSCKEFVTCNTISCN